MTINQSMVFRQKLKNKIRKRFSHCGQDVKNRSLLTQLLFAEANTNRKIITSSSLIAKSDIDISDFNDTDIESKFMPLSLNFETDFSITVGSKSIRI